MRRMVTHAEVLLEYLKDDWWRKDSVWLSYQVPCCKEVKASRQMNTKQKKHAGKITFMALFLSVEEYGTCQDHGKDTLDHGLTC